MDRWGNMVFNSKHIPINDEQKGWDGRINGSDVVSGVYVFFGSVTLKNGESLHYQGDVTVIK